MATRKGRSPTLSDQSEKSFEGLKELNAKLRVELNAEQTALKELRREKAQTIKHIQEQEQYKYSIALKDLKAKLHVEKLRELELQKEALLRKNEFDLHKVTKQHDLEMVKLQNDLRKCQDQLREINKCGLSGTARGTFEAERLKMLREVQEARKSKKAVEDAMQSVQESDKQKSFELRKLEEDKISLLAKQKKEYDVEIRKLLDEVRKKACTIKQLHQEHESGSETIAKLQQEKKCVQEALNNSTREANLREKRPSAKNNKAGLAVMSLPLLPDICVQGSNNETCNAPTDNSGQDRVDNGSLQQQKVTDLLNKLNEQCTALSQDKRELLRRVQDLGKKHKVFQERNRLFHEKNMQLSSCNRQLEERVKQLGDDNTCLAGQLGEIQRNQDRLEDQLSCHNTDRQAYDQMLEEVVGLKLDAEKQSQRVAALEKSCADKDRRIELMVHRQKKSNMCGSGLSDKFTMEEYEKNYQKFVKEHLDLERRFAVLQASNDHYHGNCVHTDAEVAKSWIEEKDELNNRVKLLKEKLGQKAEAFTQLQVLQRELEDHTETLEFRLLELEDKDDDEDEEQTVEMEKEEEVKKCQTHDQSSQTDTELGARIQELESQVSALKDCVSNYEKSDGFLADKNVSLMETLDSLKAENQALVDDYELLKYNILKATSRLRTELGAGDGGGGERRRSAKAERTEVEEEMERLFLMLESKEEKQRDVVKRLQVLVEQRETETEDKSREITALREQVKKLEESTATSSPQPSEKGVKPAVEGSTYPGSDSGQRTAELQAEIQDLTELSYQVKELQAIRKTLNERVEQLQSAAGEEHQKVDELQQQIKVLESTNKVLDQEVESLSQQVSQSHPGASVDSQQRIRDLEARLQTAQEKEKNAQESIEQVKEEKIRRVESLQEQLERMRENEIRLSETIVELEELEQDLRQQVRDGGSIKQEASTDVSKLKASEQNLRDQVEQMEHNERLLKERLSEMEEQTGNDRIKELEQTVQELSEKEASLLEEVYQKKLENQELQEHIDELLEEAEAQSASSTPRASSQSEITQQLKDTVAKLRDENSELKDQLLRSRLDAMDTIRESGELPEGVETMKDLVERLQQLEDLSKKEAAELQAKIKELEDSEQKLQDDLREKESKGELLQKKVEILEQSEGKLMEQVDVLYESEAKYKEDIEKLHQGEAKIDPELERRVAELEEKKAKLEAEMKQEKSTSKEINQLRQKVDILLDTEEKLLDRLQQQELVERQLHKDLEQSEDELEQLEKENEELQEKLKAEEKKIKNLTEALQEKEATSADEGHLRDLEEAKSTLLSHIKELEESKSQLSSKLDAADEQVRTLKDSTQRKESTTEPQIEELHNTIRSLEESIKQLERSESDLQGKLSASERISHNLQNSESSLCQQVAELEEKESSQTLQITQLRQTELRLQGKVDDLRKQNMALLEEMSNPLSLNHLSNGELQTENNNQVQRSRKAATPEPVNGRSLLKIIPDTSLLMETLPPYTPLESNQLDRMSREEMMSKIQELEEMESFHRSKIGELSSNLGTLRQAVEVVAITMETDADIPVINVRPKGRDWEFETRVQELVKTEVKLKLKVLELQKKEAILRSQLQDSELALKEQDADFKEELEVMEEEIHKLKKSEARMKNQKKYGGPGVPESASLAQIQHLDSQVHDLHASESKLKRQVQDLQRAQTDLLSKMELPLVDHLGNLRNIHDKDKYYDLLQQLKELEYSEKDVKSKLTDAQRSEGEKGGLVGRIAELECTEKGLKRKLELLESQDAGFLDEEVMILDSPEAILQQRIREMERMEKHLKTQVVELETDREELHEIARKDKVRIHEMSVLLRQTQLSEQNLKQQLHRVETKEGHLSLKVDELTDHIEELEDTIKTLEATARSLKVRLHKQQYNEEDLNFKLENTKEDMVNTETKLKKKVTELEEERRNLKRKNEQLVDTVAELEAGKFNLQEKVRQSENHTMERKDELSEIQAKHLKSEKRLVELENLNEGLMEKNRKLQEDKSSLVFEIAHLEQTSGEHDQMKKRLTVLRKQLSEEEEKRVALQKRLDEFTAKEVQSQEKMQKREKMEWELKEQITAMKVTIQQQQLQLLEAEASLLKEKDKTTESSVQKKASFTVISKGVQVQLADAFTLKQLSPEFKTAVTNLGSRHPLAYQQFVRDIQPSEGKEAETTSKLAQEKLVIPVHRGLKPAPSDQQVPRNMAVLVQELVECLPLTDICLKSPEKPSSKSQAEWAADGEQAMGQLNETEVNEAVVVPTFKPGRNQHPPRPIDVATDNERQQLIGQLVGTLPMGSVAMATDLTKEDHHWRTVEERKSDSEEECAAVGKQCWARLENNTGDCDDMALTVNVYDSEDDAEAVPVHRPMSARSIDSHASSVPPSLPMSAPPTKPHTDANADSADEISDIEEDSSLPPLPKSSVYNSHLRAKSAERDSDFSEGTWTHSGLRHHGGRHVRSATSLDSITDSGMCQEEDVRILKERILYLEKQIEKQSASTVLLHSQEMDRSRVLKAEAEAKEKYQQLQMEHSTLKEKHAGLVGRLTDMDTLKHDKQTLEKIILKLRGQLKGFERTDLQKQELEKKLWALEGELKTKAQIESELVRENARMKHHIDSLKRKRQEDLQEDFDYVESIGFSSPEVTMWTSPNRAQSKIPRRLQTPPGELSEYSLDGASSPSAEKHCTENTDKDFELSPPQLSYAPVTELQELNTNNNNVQTSLLPVYHNGRHHRHPRHHQRAGTSAADAGAGASSWKLSPGSLLSQPVMEFAVPTPDQPRVFGMIPELTVDVCTGPPEPPYNLHVERIVGHRSLLLSWSIPKLDDLSRSNGAVVKGYKIYIDSQDRQLVASPYLTKALVERLNLHHPHTFSIQTLAKNGQVSRMVNTAFDDIIPERHSSASDSASDVDQSSIACSSHGSEGEQRVFMAVYDYDTSTAPTHPSQQSLSGPPTLTFRTGDVVVTYGNLRSDGYYFAKVHGKRGLVPANFIEEVALLRSLDQRSISAGSLASYSHSSSVASSGRSSADKSRSHGHSHHTRRSKMSSAQV